VLGIVVLLKAIPIGKSTLSKWHKDVLHYFSYVEFLSHDTCKNQYWGGTSLRNPCPDVYFERMFSFRLQFWWLTRLCETDLAVLLEPDGTLVREYNVVESLSGFLAFSGERETGDTVGLSDNLAVLRAASFPTKLLSGSFNGGDRQVNTHFTVQQSLQT